MTAGLQKPHSGPLTGLGLARLWHSGRTPGAALRLALRQDDGVWPAGAGARDSLPYLW